MPGSGVLLVRWLHSVVGNAAGLTCAVIGHASDRTRSACARYVLMVILVGDLHCFLAHRFTGGVGPVGARL